jgi:thiamine biosynthesis lipoprotein
MGTEYSLYLYADSPVEAGRLAEPAFQEIDRVEDLLSNYRESSELSRINREAALGEATTDPETFRFLEISFAWSAKSHGAVDITVGKLMKAWGFYGAKGTVPSENKLAQARSQIGWQKVCLDRTNRTVRFLSPGIELDPGGMGKGYAVDRAVSVLRAQHVAAALLSAGSSTIYALGKPRGELGWKIRVPSIGEQNRTLSTVILCDASLSTANNSAKCFVYHGHLYGAIMDPRTSRPVEGTLQVSAISSSATESDILSNALFILRSKDRVSLLKQLPVVSALIVLENPFGIQCEAIRWPAEVANECCPEQIPRRSKPRRINASGSKKVGIWSD